MMVNRLCRYQSLWIPLLEVATKNGVDMDRLVPPIDIAWVWHVSSQTMHMHEIGGISARQRQLISVSFCSLTCSLHPRLHRMYLNEMTCTGVHACLCHLVQQHVVYN